MKEITLNTKISVYNSVNELPTETQKLIQEAIEARKKAYAPYSKFKVGAAILLSNGKTIIGSNQENAAYPSGLCAERVAVYQAGALYPSERILQIAITAASETNTTEQPIPPCGACRQSLIEYEIRQNTPIETFFMGEIGEIYKSDSIKNLLPFVFDKNLL